MDNENVNNEQVTEEQVATTEEKKSLESVLNDMYSRVYESMPVFVRVKSILSTIAKQEHKNNVSWDRVNSLIRSGIKDGDFNIIPQELHSIDDLISLNENVDEATMGVTPWNKRVCTDCGNEFYLYLTEVDFYRGKGFPLPKRCKSCIENRRNRNNVNGGETK